jgi:hypothetical protein
MVERYTLRTRVRVENVRREWVANEMYAYRSIRPPKFWSVSRLEGGEGWQWKFLPEIEIGWGIGMTRFALMSNHFEGTNKSAVWLP